MGSLNPFSKPKESKAVAAARQKQEDALRAQEAATQRAQQKVDEQEEKLSGESATMRRAISARRRSRGGLAFVSPAANLKTTFGG